MGFVPVGIDENSDLPLEAREAIAARIEDDASEIGAAVKAVSTAPLVGGTTGQALVKLSDDDLDIGWGSAGGGGGGAFPVGVGMQLNPRIAGTSTNSNSTDRLSLCQIVVPQDCTIDAFVTFPNGASGDAHDLGLYPSNADGSPDFSGGPVATATVTASGATVHVSTITPVALTAGIYWGAFLRNGTITMVTLSGNSTPVVVPAGLASPFNFLGYFDTSVATLPSGSFSPTPSTTTTVVIVGVRVSSVP